LSGTADQIEENVKMYKDFAAGIQDVTKFGDEAVLQQIAYAKNLGVAEDQLKDTTTAAIGLAAKLGIDLKTSMMLMGRAALGQTQMLTRYGIILDETLTPQEKFNTLLKIGAKSFRLAEEAAKTTAGRFTQFKNKVGDTFEEFGGGIVKALKLDTTLESLTERLDKLLDKWKADGTIDKWAEDARVRIESVAETLGDIFSGDESKRTAAIAKLTTAGGKFAEIAVDILLDKATPIGIKIGEAIAQGVGKSITEKGKRDQALIQGGVERGDVGRIEGAVPFFANVATGGAFEQRLRTSEQLAIIDRLDKQIEATKDLKAET